MTTNDLFNELHKRLIEEWNQELARAGNAEEGWLALRSNLKLLKDLGKIVSTIDAAHHDYAILKESQ